MNSNIFYGITGAIIGLFLGYIVAILRSQKASTKYEIKQLLLEKALHQSEQAIKIQNESLRHNEKNKHHQDLELRNAYSQLATYQERLQQLNHYRNECDLLNQGLQTQREISSSKEAELREVAIRLKEQRIAAEEKHNLLVNSEQRLSAQFENLANRIFESTGRKIDEKTQQNLDHLLLPLREQLDSFRRQVKESFGEERQERHTLKHEIHNLQQLNAKIAREAINLTKALKGSNKIQGDWGEVILNRVLEASGLREGHEYETQTKIQIDQQSCMQPDVIIHLPECKDVIIDAKVSLIAYERYFNSEDIVHQEAALNEHITSLRNHIRLLGKKDYHHLPGLRSLDYILMFIPIEPAFLVAINREPELISGALKHNIILVSPSTILVALRTITNLWRYEKQTKNAERIADRASKLYDKIRLFIDDMSALGQSLEKAQSSYHYAINKLSTGRGNCLGQIESLRSLGVEVRKPINPKLAQQASEQCNEVVSCIKKENN